MLFLFIRYFFKTFLISILLNWGDCSFSLLCLFYTLIFVIVIIFSFLGSAHLSFIFHWHCSPIIFLIPWGLSLRKPLNYLRRAIFFSTDFQKYFFIFFYVFRKKIFFQFSRKIQNAPKIGNEVKCDPSNFPAKNKKKPIYHLPLKNKKMKIYIGERQVSLDGLE